MRTIDVFDLDRIDLGAEERAAYQKVRAGLEDLVNLLVPVPGKRLSRNTLVDRIAILTQELGL